MNEYRQIKFLNRIIGQRDSYCPTMDELKNIQPTQIANVLENLFMSGDNMEAAACTFNTIFSDLSFKPDYTSNVLSPEIQNYINNLKIITVASNGGTVFIADIKSSDAQVIIKAPNSDNDEEEVDTIKREYLLGMLAVNKLRYIIPNFMYTLGIFNCFGNIKSNSTNLCETKSGQQTPFIVLEKVPGKDIKGLIEEPSFTFEKWLVIFYQLLLSLEVAQREINFTHFDLHIGNVMTRKTPSYTINLDNTTYFIEKPEYTPVIIDFGMSTATIDGETIGDYNFGVYGMMNYMVPGFDMYKFMISSSNDKRLHKHIIKIFEFYGDNDPYDMLKDPRKGFGKYRESFGKLITFPEKGKTSFAASATPLMLANWLYEKYPSILSGTIHKRSRETYIPIQFTDTSLQYNNIFGKDNRDNTRMCKLVEQYDKNQISYVLTKYNIMILTEYEKRSGVGESCIKLNNRLKNNILNNWEYLLEIDLDMLESVFSIEVPDQKVYDEILTNFCDNTGLKSRLTVTKSQINLAINYEKKLQPYLLFYFVILETGLEDKYADWLSKFVSSDIFAFYLKNIITTHRIKRWDITQGNVYRPEYKGLIAYHDNVVNNTVNITDLRDYLDHKLQSIEGEYIYDTIGIEEREQITDNIKSKHILGNIDTVELKDKYDIIVVTYSNWAKESFKLYDEGDKKSAHEKINEKLEEFLKHLNRRGLLIIKLNQEENDSPDVIIEKLKDIKVKRPFKKFDSLNNNTFLEIKKFVEVI